MEFEYTVSYSVSAETHWLSIGFTMGLVGL